MKILSYIVIPYDGLDDNMWAQIIGNYLAQENDKYEWKLYSCQTLLEQYVMKELKGCTGYLLHSLSCTDLTKLKLISECSEEELDNHIRGLE